MSLSLSIEHISKRYRLGTFGSGSAAEDIRRWWTHTVLRRPQAEPKVFQLDYGNRDGNDLWALRDVSFHVKEGEVIGIIGKNGSGKSTLLKVLSQITAPTSGRVRINGRLASLLEVGTGFHGELTGRENIFLNGSILGMSPAEIRRRFDEIVDFSEIEEFIDTPVKRYSSGMFVRLAFAVAAHLETEIMVIDEVLAVGDVGFQRKCLGKMSDASSAGRTVLFVSHRMDHIAALCSRCVVLNAGRLVFDGLTDQAIATYYGLVDQAAGTPILQRKDRVGRGNIVIEDVWIEAASGERLSTFMTGQSLEFVIALRNVSGAEAKNLLAGIAIYDSTGLFVASLTTTEGGYHGFDMGERCVVRLRVPKLPLNSASFRFDCGISKRTIGALITEDKIEAAGQFTVDYGDFHGIGFSSGGLVSIAHKAQLEGDARQSEMA